MQRQCEEIKDFNPIASGNRQTFTFDMCNQLGYTNSMIKSFAHKGLEIYHHTSSRKGIQANHAQKLADVLDRLEASDDVRDVKYPGSDLHQLKCKMKGKWAVKISGNWRVVFDFTEGDAYNVDYTDYH